MRPPVPRNEVVPPRAPDAAPDAVPEREGSLIGSAFKSLLKIGAPIGLFLLAQHTGALSAAGNAIGSAWTGAVPDTAQKWISQQMAQPHSQQATTFFRSLLSRSRNMFAPGVTPPVP